LLDHQREIQKLRYANHLGEILEIAVEGHNSQRGQVIGRSSQNITVNFTVLSPILPAPGNYLPVQITQSFPNSLLGQAIA
jgi:tRNA-2-methylthio-N6-dimethylallyladenosine synthase